MNIQIKSILLVFLMLLIPSTLFAGGVINTGYDLYNYLKSADKQNKTLEESTYSLAAISYLVGCVEGIDLMQHSISHMMFPRYRFSKEEREKLSKELNFHILNIPTDNLVGGQLALIYKKWAEKYPQRLNESARMCVFASIVEAYGWD